MILCMIAVKGNKNFGKTPKGVRRIRISSVIKYKVVNLGLKASIQDTWVA